MTDCLLIGHNDPDFASYVTAVRQLGERSATFRDLRLSYLLRDGRPTTFPALCNAVRGTSTPFGITAILSPAVAYLASYIARRGFTFDWANDFQKERETIARKLRSKRIRTVAITTTYYMSPTPVTEIVEFVRSLDPDCKIIVGGPYIHSLHVAGQYRGMFRALGADYYVISQQGQASLAALLRVLRDGGSIHGVPNLAYRSGAGIVVNSIQNEVADLDADPVDWQPFAGAIGSVASIRSAVSCPFSCAFCGFPTRGGDYKTSKPLGVERELDQLASLEEIEAIQFVDDTFNVPPERYKQILKTLIRKQYGFKWNCQYRCQYADHETVALMKESGCEGVFLGIEAANNDVLRNMNKHVTVEDYYRGLELLNQYEIPSHANFIIGFPGETDTSVADLKRFLRQARPTFYRAQLWYCDPTTPVWSRREQYGVQGQGFEWRHATMEAEEAQAHVESLFGTWDETPWTPQYNFEFYGVCQLTHEGMTLAQIERAIRSFNRGVRQQLEDREASADVIGDVVAALAASSPIGDAPSPNHSSDQPRLEQWKQGL